MPSLWIVHREPHERAALARLAAAGEDAVLGGPADPQFDSAPPADAVLVGVTGDLEAELEFAHRVTRRLAGAKWILVADRRDLASVRRLFDTLDAECLAFPPDARALRARIRRADRSRESAPLPLSQRPGRDELAERFSRWFADLELPELLRALDPRLADVPLLICGEPGSGRALLARYVHSFGGTANGALVHLPCAPGASAAELLEVLSAGARSEPTGAPCSVWLDDVDRLPLSTQRQLRAWTEFSAPRGALRAGRVRWIATAGEDADERLDPALRQILGALSVRIPPLRERPDLIAGLANATAAAWCAARGERARRLGEDAIAVLEEYPWPGNLRELESVVVQTLAAGASDPVRAAELQCDGAAFAPIGASEIGSLVVEEVGAEPAPRPVEPVAPVWDEDVEAVLGAVEAEAEPPRAPAPGPGAAAELRRLAGAIAHGVRNPLSSIRTFADLLPERYQDGEFRTRFAEQVGHDVRRIEAVVERLSQLAELGPPRSQRVDVAALLEDLLAERRDAIRRRRLLVLKELDAEASVALGDPDQLRIAFEALLDRALEIATERGDVYCASRRCVDGLRGAPSVRVLLRLAGGVGVAPEVPGVSIAENALEFAAADTIVRGQGGALTIDSKQAGDTLVVVDLPAPD